MHAHHHHQITLGLAFFLGAVHALEPGHGKTAMVAYLSEHRRNFLHPILMGLSSGLAHSVSLVVIAFVVHWARTVAGTTMDSETVSFWLNVVSVALIFCVGIWMLMAAARRKPHSCGCRHHRETSDGGGTCGSQSSDSPAEKSAGYSMSAMLGAAFGLLPCPSALAACLGGTTHGSAGHAYLTIALFAAGIASSLAAAGLGIQLVGKRLSEQKNWAVRLPWPFLRAALVLVVGGVYATRLIS